MTCFSISGLKLGAVKAVLSNSAGHLMLTANSPSGKKRIGFPSHLLKMMVGQKEQYPHISEQRGQGGFLVDGEIVRCGVVVDFDAGIANLGCEPSLDVVRESSTGWTGATH